MSYHPDCTLRSTKLEVHLAYDGSVHVHSVADVLDPQGLPTNHQHTHGTRFAPNEWHDLSLREMCRVAHHNHHRFLGLGVPDDADAPLHLHPQGHPAFPANRTPGHRHPHDPSTLAHHIMDQREREMRGRDIQTTGTTTYQVRRAEHPLLRAVIQKDQEREAAARAAAPTPSANPALNALRRTASCRPVNP